jgi:hypothetical protein
LHVDRDVQHHRWQHEQRYQSCGADEHGLGFPGRKGGLPRTSAKSLPIARSAFISRA